MADAASPPAATVADTVSPASKSAQQSPSSAKSERLRATPKHTLLLAPAHSPLSRQTPKGRVDLSGSAKPRAQGRENLSKQPLSEDDTSVVVGARLYQSAVDSRAVKERELRRVAIDLRDQATFKTSTKTSELASSFWLKRLKELVKSKSGADFSGDRITLELFRECMSGLGLPAKSQFPSSMILKECGVQSQNESNVGEGSSRVDNGEEQMLDYSRLEVLIRAALDAVPSEFSPRLVNAIRLLFACPVARAEHAAPTNEPSKKVSIREFLRRLEEEDREQKDRRERLVRELREEEAKSFTFKPKISSSSSSLLSKMKRSSEGETNSAESKEQAYVRLFREAETRRRKLELSALDKSREDVEKSMLECSFHPSISESKTSFHASFLGPAIGGNGLNDSSFVSVVHLWEEDYIQMHLDRMERARQDRLDKQHRLDQLGLSSTAAAAQAAVAIGGSSSPTAITAAAARKRGGTASSKGIKAAQLEVVLKDGSTLCLDLKRDSDAAAIAGDLAIKCSLNTREHEYVLQGIERILNEYYHVPAAAASPTPVEPLSSTVEEEVLAAAVADESPSSRHADTPPPAESPVAGQEE